MDSFLLYTFIILFVSALYPVKKRNNFNNTAPIGKDAKIYLFITLGLMCFMTGFRRYDVGNDTEAYRIYFSNLATEGFSADGRIETGYKYLNVYISEFTHDYTDFLVITSLILFGAMYKYISAYGKSVKLYVCLFWFYAYVPFINPLRQSLALSIILFSLSFVKRKKYLLFLLFCYLATLFHNTAVIAVFLLPLYYIKPKDSKLFLVLFITIILVATNGIDIFSKYILDDYYSRYLEVQSGVGAGVFNAVFGFMPVILDHILLRRDVTTKPSYYNLIKWSSVVYACFYIASLYTGGAGRLAYYFFPMTLSYWCYVICKMKKNNRIITILLLFVIAIIYRALVLLYRPEWNSFFPFYYVWE